MEADHPESTKELLIVSLTPEFLERGVLWFKEHEDQVASARAKNPWWREHTLLIEKDLQIKPSEFIRRLMEFGYERTQTVRGRGLFAVRGGLIELWPLNKEAPYVVEFTGNAVATIHEREVTKEIAKPKAKLAQSIDTLSEGSYVVHEDHGIGIFRGILTNREAGIVNHENTKFYIIEYAAPIGRTETDRLFVPIEQKDRLTPYIGFETPRIHRLGGSIWQNTKRKVKEDTEKLAAELIQLYATRDIRTRPSYLGDPVLEEELRQTFLLSKPRIRYAQKKKFSLILSA